MPKVSVIIPSYNCERYIAETISSVLDQSFKDIELIVVDDGSSDRTREIVSSFGAPVRLIAQANAGRCVARNRGIREASGEFICLLDHDDCWFPDKLARQLSEFQKHPEAGAVYSSFIFWHADSENRFPDPESFDLTAFPDTIDPGFSGWIYHQSLIDIYVLTSTAMFRAEVFQRCGNYDESLPYSEDWELLLRIAREYPFVQLRRPTTLYRQHRQQGSRVTREVDYRTMLLTRTVKKWGLCSRDGSCVTRRQFLNQLAVYHASFALDHLKNGKKKIAFISFIKAWLAAPFNLKYPAYIAAALLGWKPTW
ncbi:MAG: glycosyltransferase [Proteobacteria bacterium]|nr:glycosyltransferase [Pseudomonadota bacterium]